MYCILLKEQTEKAPVVTVYMMPVMALESLAKQNTSCIAQISWGGNTQSTSARAAIMLDCILRIKDVLAWCQRMCPLSVAVEPSRWFLINVAVRPGMVGSSSLRSSAHGNVDAGREHMIWWM